MHSFHHSVCRQQEPTHRRLEDGCVIADPNFAKWSITKSFGNARDGIKLATDSGPSQFAQCQFAQCFS